MYDVQVEAKARLSLNYMQRKIECRKGKQAMHRGLNAVLANPFRRHRCCAGFAIGRFESQSAQVSAKDRACKGGFK